MQLRKLNQKVLQKYSVVRIGGNYMLLKEHLEEYTKEQLLEQARSFLLVSRREMIVK